MSVASQFGAIGLDDTSQGEFSERVVSLISAGTARQIAPKIGEHVWTDPSGARLVAQVRKGGIEFLLPCLAGTTPAVTGDNKSEAVWRGRLGGLAARLQDEIVFVVGLGERLADPVQSLFQPGSPGRPPAPSPRRNHRRG
ncbi:hypothetical protein [Amycolatopsis sp. lyj-90]|uniref:hypothetical protein n=1 Tax=Amycolatopsis sp. lyj-90 TaxID=2789285 RepID=UPI003978F6BD